MLLHNFLATHCRVIKLGQLADSYTANNILRHYTLRDFKHLSLACKLFDEIPQRDTVSWNTIISGFLNFGDLGTAWKLQKSMLTCGFEMDAYTFGSVLKGIALASRVDLGKQVHSLVVKMGYQENVYAGSALLDMYSKCDNLGDAYEVFGVMPFHNSVSWNAMINGFVRVRDREFAFRMLGCMDMEGVRPDDGTLSPLLTLLDDARFYQLMQQIHCKIVKCGLGSYASVCNAMITSYSSCGSIEDAKNVFNGSCGTRDLVALNSMIAAYEMHEEIEVGLQLFLDMPLLGFDPDIYTYTSVISACSVKAHEGFGRSLHGVVVKMGLDKSIPVYNALMAMYIEIDNGSMDNALRVFQSMELKDQVSWNSILTGFSKAGLGDDAVKFFILMRSLKVEIDHYALSASLRSCSDLAALLLGQQVHVLAIKLGFESNDFVASSLIFMYSKCGVIEHAHKSFEETSKDSSITWNSIMFAYAQHGQGDITLELFSLMRERRVRMDHITFVAVLTACSHVGLVEQGRRFLDSMASDYGIPPRMEHYACAIDLYGRAGRLEEAKALVESMPFEPDALVWKTLLGACRACGNIELATQIATHLLDLEPEEHCTYVILTNMYGHLKRWGDKARVTRLMRERKVRKVPGYSWIEVNNEVQAFKAEHPISEDVNKMLEEILREIIWLDSDRSSCFWIDHLE